MTQAQLKRFWRAVHRAASMLGLVGGEAVDGYRRTVMLEEAGVRHAREVDPVDGYDRVMYRLAVDAGDWAAATRFATGGERRMAHLVEQCARQVIELGVVLQGDPYLGGGDPPDKARAYAVSYIVGCLEQADMPIAAKAGEWWLDISGSMSFSVFRMLDTHRRRLLRALGWHGPLAFDADASWSGRPMSLDCGRHDSRAGHAPAIRVGCVPA